MSDARLDVLERQVRALEKLLRRVAQSEGTWTPAFAGDSTAGVYTYTQQVGVYTRIGNLIYLWGWLLISAIGTPPVGTMSITGLPFVAEASRYHPVTFGYIGNFNNAANAVQLTAFVVAATSRIDLFESFDNGAAVNVPAANFTNTAAQIIFSAVYRAAA